MFTHNVELYKGALSKKKKKKKQSKSTCGLACGIYHSLTYFKILAA